MEGAAAVGMEREQTMEPGVDRPWKGSRGYYELESLKSPIFFVHSKEGLRWKFPTFLIAIGL
jgi:hypothetical protein